MKTLRTLFAAALAAVVVSSFAAPTTTSPAGHWHWSGIGAGGVPAEVDCELTYENAVLAGTAKIGDTSVAISDASFKNGVAAFSVVRMVHDGAVRFEEKYSGRLDGDTLAGTYERPTAPPGGPVTTPWKAQRAAASPAGATSGALWTWTANGPQGPIEVQGRFEMKDGMVNGVIIARGSEKAIEPGTIKDGKIEFIIIREMQGEKLQVKYSGKLEGDTITGTIDRPLPDSDERQVVEWKATRVK